MHTGWGAGVEPQTQEMRGKYDNYLPLKTFFLFFRIAMDKMCQLISVIYNL